MHTVITIIIVYSELVSNLNLQSQVYRSVKQRPKGSEPLNVHTNMGLSQQSEVLKQDNPCGTHKPAESLNNNWGEHERAPHRRDKHVKKSCTVHVQVLRNPFSIMINFSSSCFFLIIIIQCLLQIFCDL